jgi:thiol-disulfide isomerase/thioredoxin
MKHVRKFIQSPGIVLACTAVCFIGFLPVTGISSAPGDAAPPFSLPTLDTAQEISLADFRGKVVYLDFWASWCGPCRKSLPLYEEMKEQFSPERFQIVAINLDEDRQDAVRFLEQHPVSYTVLLDPAGTTASQWQMQAMPTSFLLDGEGRVIKSWAGFYPSHLEDIENEIRAALE